MPEIQWSDDLSVGIELIDEQHRVLIERMNDVSTATEAHHGVEKIAKTLDFLVEYTDFHFSTEEKHMATHSYPGLEEHHAKHEELKDTLRNLEQDFKEEGATFTLADSVNTLLGNWLMKHIKAVDVPFGAFLKEKGITLPKES
ncbi:bacteriohemerythrin [Candidatus Zixiibacteriota bacterium]